jgi:flagellar basal-body rod protein FlgF
MLAEDAAQQVISQNLANASTTGYKEEVPRFESFEENLVACSDDQGGSALGTLGNGTDMTGSFTDTSDGPLQQTGNNLDIALRGNNYFAVQTDQQTLYSRDGALAISSNGSLVQAASGLPILDIKGRPIVIPNKSKTLSIASDGNVDVDGVSVGQIGLFALSPDDNPTKMGGNLISTVSTPVAADPATTPVSPIMSGYLESSNVNIVKEMVTMIACTRAYEANAKTLQAHDAVQEKAVTEIGKVA